MKYFQKTYDNGLRLILEKNDRPVTAACIMFFVGSQNETKSEEGYAHFIEHMAFKSSEKFSTEEAMDKLTMLGADYNAFTSKTVTRYVFKCLAENFEETFELYSDLVLRSKFDKNELDKERDVIIEEMKKYQDDPVELMYEKAVENFYEGTTYAHDALGNEKVVGNATREKLLAFKNRFYNAHNCIISVTGNIDFDKLDKIVTRYFANTISGDGKPYEVDFSLLKPNIKNNYKIITRNDEQANVCISVKSVSYASDKKYIADIYASILGNSQNSRLFKRIREDLGLVYTIYAINEIGARVGEIDIVFGTRPKNVKKALFEIRAIIEKLASDGVSDDEVQRAINLKKSCTLYALESSSEIADINASMVHYHGKPLSQAERMKNYDKVTAKDINEFARQIANESSFAVVAVGNGLKSDDLEVFRQI